MRKMLMAAGLAVAVCAGAAAQDQVYKVGEKGVRAPVLVKETKPDYTPSAMRRKVEGVVEMSAIIRETGVPDSFEITRSLDEELDEEAIKALSKWEFKPGTLEGKPVAVRVNVEMTFTLRRGEVPK